MVKDMKFSLCACDFSTCAIFLNWFKSFYLYIYFVLVLDIQHTDLIYAYIANYCQNQLTSIIMQLQIFFIVMETFKIYSLSNFQIYDRVLLTSHHAVNYILRNYLQLEVCAFWPPSLILPISQLLPLATTNLFLGIYEFGHFRFHIWDHIQYWPLSDFVHLA